MLLENVQGGKRRVVNLRHKYGEILYTKALIITPLNFLTVKSVE